MAGWGASGWLDLPSGTPPPPKDPWEWLMTFLAYGLVVVVALVIIFGSIRNC